MNFLKPASDALRLLSERPRASVWVLLLSLSVVEFWLRFPVLSGARALYGRDLFPLYFPLVQTVLRVLSEGALPLRDPTTAFGQPMLANPDAQILYPPAWLHVVLPPALAYAWIVSIHSVFGSLGVALLSRRLSGGSVLAAFVSGFAWLLSGPLQSLTNVWHHMAGAAWIPWILLAVLRILAGHGRQGSIALGGALGAQMLAGSADMCAMTILVTLLFIPLREGLRVRRAWLISAALGIALGAGVWLPAGEIVLTGRRAHLTEAVRTQWSLHPLSALEFFLPVPLSAIPLQPEWRTAVFDRKSPFLDSVFLGAAFFPLCLAALADGPLSRRVRLASFLGVAGGLLIALGKNAPVYAWVITVAPPLGIFRYPTKAMIPVNVLVCVLAGAGATALGRSSRARAVAIAATLVLGGIALTLMGPGLSVFVSTFLDATKPGRVSEVWAKLPLDLLFSICILALLALWVRWPSGRMGVFLGCLLFLGHLRQSLVVLDGLNPTVPSRALGRRPGLLPMVDHPEGGRLYVYDYWLFGGRSLKLLGREPPTAEHDPQRQSPDESWVEAESSYLFPLTGAYWGVEYAWDADLRGLFDGRLFDLTLEMRRVEGMHGFLKLLQISGVTHVVALHEQGMEDLRLVTRQKSLYSEPLRLFEVPDAMPRAFLTTGRARSSGRDIADLLGAEFDPRTSVLVDEGPQRPSFPGFAGSARVEERKADRLTVETVSNHPAFLTVLEGWMPGWRVWVDGEPAHVERANAVFIGTEVPQGSHRVTFRFLPPLALIGGCSSAMAALLLAVLALRLKPEENT